MNAVPVSLENDAKRAELDAVINNIEERNETCRIELHFQNGRLSSGHKFIGILK